MLVVSLTGGIGSGKTAVSNAFAERGVPIIDTDLLARELVAPGQPALGEIVAAFGPVCLDFNGTLNRQYLRQVVFSVPEQRERLQQILHPRIRITVKQRIAQLEAPYCIVVVPLLVESGMTDLAQRILVVDTAESNQIRRVMTRDSVDLEHARRIVATQATREQRLAVADDVIENEEDLTTLDSAVEALHMTYLAISSEGNGTLPSPAG
jgi:dephospho-CoA kinase